MKALLEGLEAAPVCAEFTGLGLNTKKLSAEGFGPLTRCPGELSYTRKQYEGIEDFEREVRVLEKADEDTAFVSKREFVYDLMKQVAGGHYTWTNKAISVARNGLNRALED